MKPLGHRAYGSIPHLPGSKLGEHDKYITEGQSRYLTEKKPTKNHVVVVQTKLDGSCVSVAKIDGQIVPIGRAGYLLADAPYPHLVEFCDFVQQYRVEFDALLGEGERVVGEWMNFALSTQYTIARHVELFRPFDIMRGHERLHALPVQIRCDEVGFRTVPTLSYGEAISIEHARSIQDNLNDEGIVYRMENHKNGRVEYLAKWVRPDYVPGLHLGMPIRNKIAHEEAIPLRSTTYR